MDEIALSWPLNLDEIMDSVKTGYIEQNEVQKTRGLADVLELRRKTF